MSGHAIQTLFTFYLAAFSRNANTIENLDFWALLRVTQGEFAPALSYRILMQQVMR